MRKRKQELDEEFCEGYGLLEDVLRFEVDLGKKSIKNTFGSRSFFNLNLNNYDFLIDYLNKILIQDITSFSENYFDWKEMVYKRRDLKDVVINPLSTTGHLTDKFNFVIKHSDFLNNPFSKTGDALYSKIRRFKEKGVFNGRGKDLFLNQPYRSLLDIYNHYVVFDEWNTKIKSKQKTTRRCRVVSPNIY